MRYIFLFLLSFLQAYPVFADDSLEPLLNTVTLQFSSEQWVATKTALVTVGINASLSGNALEKSQSQFMSKLNQVSNKGEWHIMSFVRTQDQSGLERVQASAQARLPSSDLSGLRDKVKAISVPGETYTLDNVEFIPSEEELRDANTTLRNAIYQQAKNEIDSLNKLYTDQKFYIHNINFQNIVQPVPMTAQNPMYLRTSGMAAASNGASIAVGGKLNVMATVVVASAPSADVVKMIHG